jgi:hypothetical protein
VFLQYGLQLSQLTGDALWDHILQEGLYEDALVCRVKDNPEPVVFPLSVVGAKPQVGPVMPVAYVPTSYCPIRLVCYRIADS